MDITEESQKEWEDDLVREYMQIPKPLLVTDCEQSQFQDICQEWRLGRAIYKDRVVVVKAGQPTRSHSITVKRADCNLKRLPNPIFYLGRTDGSVQLAGRAFHMDSMEENCCLCFLLLWTRLA